jgi:hypothetical protein
MSAESVLVCYGVRYEIVAETEVEQLERRTHAKLASARQVHLKHWWGRFADREGERTFLFVGAIIGNFGAEGATSAQLTETELSELIQTTKARLAEGGIDDEPALFVQVVPDN